MRSIQSLGTVSPKIDKSIVRNIPIQHMTDPMRMIECGRLRITWPIHRKKARNESGACKSMYPLYIFTIIILLLLLVILLYFLNQHGIGVVLLFGILILAIIGWCLTERDIAWTTKFVAMYERMRGQANQAAMSTNSSSDTHLGAGVTPSAGLDTTRAPATSETLANRDTSRTGGGAGQHMENESWAPQPSNVVNDGTFFSSTPRSHSTDSSFGPSLEQSGRFTWLPQLPSWSLFRK